MSLDIYLEGAPREEMCFCSCGHEHTRIDRERFFESNFTHNLVPMAERIGIYEQLWRAGEAGITQARQLTEPLRAAIATMEREPDACKLFNPCNGWGSYNSFLSGLKRLLMACEEHPDAFVRSSA